MSVVGGHMLGSLLETAAWCNGYSHMLIESQLPNLDGFMPRSMA